jgi:hypothetical protein
MEPSTLHRGKARNMHVADRKRKIKGTGGKGKAIVFGVLERGGKVHTQVIEDRLSKTIRPILKDRVIAGANPLHRCNAWILRAGFGLRSSIMRLGT